MLQIILFYFIGKPIQAQPDGLLHVSQGKYFPFVLIGLAFSPIFSFGLSFCSDFIREETSYGTIESLFALPIRIEALLISASAGKLLIALIECFTVLCVGFVFLNIQFSFLKIIVLLIIIFVSIIIYFGLGLIAGSFIVVFKRGDPIQWVLINLSDILGGVYFPVALFPDKLKSISFIIPTTHILSAARNVALSDTYKDVLMPLTVLTCIGITLLYVGFIIFRKALDTARRRGSLGHF